VDALTPTWHWNEAHTAENGIVVCFAWYSSSCATHLWHETQSRVSIETRRCAG